VTADLRDFNDLPCQNPLRMDDWFIPKGGKLTSEEIGDVELRVDDWISEHLHELSDLSQNELDSLREKRIDEAVKAEEKDAARRRAEAIRSCFLDCPMTARLLCLDEGIKAPEWGIYGGYPEEERRQIAQAVKARGRGDTKRAAKAIISSEREHAINRGHEVERAAAALNVE